MQSEPFQTHIMSVSDEPTLFPASRIMAALPPDECALPHSLRPHWQALATQGLLGTLDESGAWSSRRDRQTSEYCELKNDFQAAYAFLERDRNPNTYALYELALYRFYWYCIIEHHEPVSAFSQADALEYPKFLYAPPAGLIHRAGRRKAGAATARRYPFSGPLGIRSARLQLTIVSTYLDWLCSQRYLFTNPLRTAVASLQQLARDAYQSPDRDAKLRADKFASVQPTGSVQRYLTPRAKRAVEEALAEWPATDWKTHLERARARFLVAWVYGTACRVGDVVQTRMGDIRYANGQWSWWVIGKGDTPAEIPVPTLALDALKRYRTIFGLPALPAHDEARPLVGQIRTARSKALPAVVGGFGDETTLLVPLIQNVSLKRQVITLIFKDVARRAIDRIRTQSSLSDEDNVAIARLEASSTHWWRHTRATVLSDFMDLPSLQAFLRHKDSRTTASFYLHREQADLGHKVDAADGVSNPNFSLQL